MFVDGHKGEGSCNGQLAVFRIHLLHKNVDLNLQTRISDVCNGSDKLHNSTRGDGFSEIYPIAANSNHDLPAKACSRDESNFIHHVHGRSAKECVVVVGGIGENSLENTCFRSLDLFFYSH